MMRGDVRDRQKVTLGFVGQLVLFVGMHGERSRPDRQERVVVAGADECIDGDETVAARTILDHHRLAPSRASRSANSRAVISVRSRARRAG